MRSHLSKLVVLLLIMSQAQAQKVKSKNAQQPLAVLAYYSGNATEIDKYDVQKTHAYYL